MQLSQALTPEHPGWAVGAAELLGEQLSIQAGQWGQLNIQAGQWGQLSIQAVQLKAAEHPGWATEGS